MSVERAYLERFVGLHRQVLKGDVLEVGRHEWTIQGHWAAVGRLEVVDLDPTNDSMTLVGDLCDQDLLPPEAFDCVVAFHALSRAKNPEVALINLWRAVRPTGSLLVSVPGLEVFHPSGDGARWRWTPESLEVTLRESIPDAHLEVSTFGSLASATAHLAGLSAADVGVRAMSWHDPRYPVAICARLDRRDRRPTGGAA